MRLAYLSVELVRGSGCGIGEVDAARMRAGHGQRDEVVTVFVVEVGRQARTLVAENQRIIRLERAVEERARAVRAEEKEVRRLHGGEERRPRIVYGQAQMLPVIQTCAPDILVRKVKAQWTDKVQHAVETHTEATDRTGIMRNLRFDQHKMERGCHAYRVPPGVAVVKEREAWLGF